MPPKTHSKKEVNPQSPPKSSQPKRKIKNDPDSDVPEPTAPSPPSRPTKKAKVEVSDTVPIEEEFGIVDRRYYPRQMSTARCDDYMQDRRRKPIAQLEDAIASTSTSRSSVKPKGAVVHWFKTDTRLHDNHALHLASTLAATSSIPLLCVYLVSPQDFEAHSTAPIRVDFIMRNLACLRDDLAKLDIPLYIEIVPERRDVEGRLLALCEEWGAAHLFANMEYEVDELRREARLVKNGARSGVHVTVVHDTCVVPPGRLASGAGRQFSVYTPWYRAWMRYLHEHGDLLELFPPPAKNPREVRSRFKALFECEVPDPATEKLLESKRLEPEQRERFHHYWPAGEREAQDRLKRFLAEKVHRYADSRNLPAANSTALLSCHFAAGTLSARTAVRAARDRNTSQKLDSGNKGVIGWISEVAWRDFYKHVMVHWPYVVMAVPFKPEYNNVKWDYDREKFQTWAEGRTGFPIVDAAVRQMHQMGYMHNRCRMVAASFLCKDLLQDWRMGERYFMEHLIDGDFASNNGGWGFSSSSGVDPQPYFRIFNPYLQSEKFDPDGEYIRKWVPELKDVKGKAIHNPYGEGAGKIAKANGYPEPCVEHKAAREKALKMYKEGLGRSTA